MLFLLILSWVFTICFFLFLAIAIRYASVIDTRLAILQFQPDSIDAKAELGRICMALKIGNPRKLREEAIRRYSVRLTKINAIAAFLTRQARRTTVFNMLASASLFVVGLFNWGDPGNQHDRPNNDGRDAMYAERNVDDAGSGSKGNSASRSSNSYGENGRYRSEAGKMGHGNRAKQQGSKNDADFDNDFAVASNTGGPTSNEAVSNVGEIQLDDRAADDVASLLGKNGDGSHQYRPELDEDGKRAEIAAPSLNLDITQEGRDLIITNTGYASTVSLVGYNGRSKTNLLNGLPMSGNGASVTIRLPSGVGSRGFDKVRVSAGSVSETVDRRRM